jgi:arginine deiminase
MKIAEKVLRTIAESAYDISDIADYLTNSLEHEENEKDGVQHLVKEFSLTKEKAAKLISWWYKLDAKKRNQMSFSNKIMISSIEKELGM